MHTVICTHLMPALTPSLPLLAVSLCMCRHSSAAVMPCGCDCTPLRCWWLPLPFHFFFLLLLSSSYTSPSLRHQVCVCVCVCVGGEGEGGACFTQPHHQPLATNSRLVAEGEEGVSRSQAVRVAAPPLPPPFPLLCCIVCWCQHGTCCSHPAHTTTTPVMASWPHCLSSPLPSL